MRIVITNTFHNRKTYLHIADKRGHTISEGQRRRVWRDLCGLHDCTCGNDLGERPSLHALVRMEPAGKGKLSQRYQVIHEHEYARTSPACDYDPDRA